MTDLTELHARVCAAAARRPAPAQPPAPAPVDEAAIAAIVAASL